MKRHGKKLQSRTLCFEQMECRRVLAAALDPAFGEQGIVIENVRYATRDDVTDLVSIPGGGYIAVGTSDVFGNTSLLKYRQDGSIDRSFGDDGRASITTGQQLFTNNPTPPPITKSIAIDQSGRILVAGYLLTSGNQNFAVARFSANGRLDTSFGINGIKTVFAPGVASVFDVAVDQQDRIILVGTRYTNSVAKDDIAVVRLLPNGNLDSSFANAGVQVLDFQGKYDEAIGVTITPAGRIVVAAHSFDIGVFGREDFEFRLITLLTNGEFDSTFGVNGTQQLIGPAGAEFFYSDFKIDGLGRLLVGGTLASMGTSQPAVARLTATGHLETSFGDQGWRSLDLGLTFYSLRELTVDALNNIWLLGAGFSANANADLDVSIGKLLSTGELDAGFGHDGILQVDFANHKDVGGAIVVDENNAIIIAATANQSAVASTTDFALARILSNSEIDNSFGFDGRVLTDFGLIGSNISATASATQGDGSLLMAGDRGIARFSPQGTRDEFFGTGGVARTDFQVLALATDTSNRILAIGSQNSDFVVTRFLANGDVDTNFAGSGSKRIDFSNRSDIGRSLAIDSFGRIVVAGYSFQPSPTNQDFAVARLTDNGDLDPTFGNGGKRTIDFSNSIDQAFAVSIDSQDRIIIGGQSAHGASTQLDFAIARLLINGDSDSTFGSNGVSFIDFAGLNDEFASLVVDESDRVVAFGAAQRPGNNETDFALARLTDHGLIDSEFASNGKLFVDIAGRNDFASQIALDSQGRIVMAGTSSVPLAGRPGNFDFAVVRVLDSGSIDQTFGGTGIQTIDVGSNSESSSSLLVDGQDRVVIAGSSDLGTPTFKDVAIVRLLAESSPPVAVAGGPYQFDEGALFNLDGALSYDIDNPTSALSFAWDLDYDGVHFQTNLVGVSPTLRIDDNFAPRTIALKVTDPSGLSTIATTTLSINNVSPFAISTSVIEGGVRGQTLRLEGTFTDPGLLDTHTYAWNVVKDGQPLVINAPTNQPTLSFVPVEAGSYLFTFRVTDDDGGEGSTAQTLSIVKVALQSVPGDTTQTQLVVGGAIDSDRIHLRWSGGGIHVDLNSESFGPYVPDQIVVYAQDGDDDIFIPNNIVIDALLFGGDGNDRILAGSGDDILVGGDGDDFLQGNMGRDVVIGGRGADRIMGNGDDDLLIGSWTSFDTNRFALSQISMVWRSELEFSSRVYFIRYGTGAPNYTGVRLQQNVFADFEVDYIMGASGDDWFIAGSEDKLLDLNEKKLEADFDWLIN